MKAVEANAGVVTLTQKKKTQQSGGGLGLRMLFGACSGMVAASCCHPLDVLRVQLQVDSEGGATRQYRGMFDCAKQLVRKHGVATGLYNGIGAAYLRQWTYGSCRIGIYSYLFATYKPKSLWEKMVFGSISGGIGSVAGTPAELALVRFAADTKAPVEQRRNYKNIFDCIRRIAAEEGVLSLWSGVGITVMRAMVMGSCQMGVASQAKEQLRPHISNKILLIFSSAAVGSVVAVTATMPFDVIKSRLQNMPIDPTTGRGPYTGMVDCLRKSVAAEGATVLFKGYTPALIKLAPYVTISLTVLDTISNVVTGKAGF